MKLSANRPILHLLALAVLFGILSTQWISRKADATTAEAKPNVRVDLQNSEENFTLWKTLKGHKDDVTSVAFSPNGTTIASGSMDRDVFLWDAQTGELKQKLEQKGNKILQNILVTGWVLTIAYAPDGNTLATGNQNGSVRVWNIQTGAEQLFLKEVHKRGCQAVAFSSDGKILASGGVDKSIKLWNAQTGEMKLSMMSDKQIMSLAFAPDGATIASASNKSVTIWDVATGKMKLTLTGKGWMSCVKFSPDGRTVAGGDDNDAVQIWNAETGALERTLTGRDDLISIAFSPDGKILAGGCRDKSVRIWNVQTGELKQTLKADNVLLVDSVAFSPDGKMLVTGGDDNTVKLWRIGQ